MPETKAVFTKTEMNNEWNANFFFKEDPSTSSLTLLQGQLWSRVIVTVMVLLVKLICLKTICIR